jgi:hypothetical protein
MKRALIWALAQLYRTAPGVEIAHLNQPKMVNVACRAAIAGNQSPGGARRSISTDPGALAAPHFFK